MAYPLREAARANRADKHAPPFFIFLHKGDFFRCPRGAAPHVFFERGVKIAVAVLHIVKRGNGLVQARAAQTGKLFLEITDTRAQKRRLRPGRNHLETFRPLNKKVGPPPAALTVPRPGIAVPRGYHGERPAAPVRHTGKLPGDMARYPRNVFHYLIGMMEHRLIYPLVEIPHGNPGLVPPGRKRRIDMSCAKRLRAFKITVKGEVFQKLFQ